MERLIAVWCPTLLHQGELGEEARVFARVVTSVQAFCPWVDTVRLGVCVLPARGPSRFFGGESVVLDELTAALGKVVTANDGPGGGEGRDGGAYVGVADGLFAAVLAARSRLIVPSGGTADFLAPWSVAVLRRDELVATLQRLGVRTLGQFAALPTRHVLARFGVDAEACHRVARGVDGELAGLRDPELGRRLRVARGDADDVTHPVQSGFFGGASAADHRAASAFVRLQDRLGVGAVLVGCVQGGRSPSERARLVPWGAGGGARAVGVGGGGGGAHTRPDIVAPWPGRLPSPSPVRVLGDPAPAEMVDASGHPVGVSGRGLLTIDPSALSVGGGPWQEVVAWAGPWPAAERWWSARRRRARLQVVTAGGGAVLLAAERERWWVEGVYE